MLARLKEMERIQRREYQTHNADSLEWAIDTLELFFKAMDALDALEGNNDE